MFNEFQLTAREIFRAAQREGRLVRNPDDDQLCRLARAEPEVRSTRYGSIAVDSEPMSRAAMKIFNNVDTPFGDAEIELLRQARKQLSSEQLISLDVQVGDGAEGVTARLILPQRHAHVAYGGMKLFKPAITEDPTYQVLMYFDEEFPRNRQRSLPQKDITIRLAHAADGKLVKFVRNSNYFGEWKKGVFAGEDYRVKLAGDAIFLHAGCRKDTLETSLGPYRTTHSLFVALSANGKTSLTCKVLARKGHERSWLIQDDGGILYRDGRFRGFEPGGLFIKTDALNPGDQIEAYYACLKPHTFLENVYLDQDLSIDFFNMERTSNGRAVVERRDFMHAASDINAERVDNLFLITRGGIIPAVARLTHEQAAAFMVLGQSMESSAGDPTQAGKIKNEFFYDPFVAGDKGEHANLFYDILQQNPHIQCYLLNTGWVGEGNAFRDITLRDTMNVLDALLRDGVPEWTLSDRTGLEVPRALPAVDTILVRPERLYSPDDFDRLQAALDRQRAEYIDTFPGLDSKIRAVFQKAALKQCLV